MVEIELKKILLEKGIIKFKLYSLNYTIQNKDGGVVIFVDSYKYSEKSYNNIDELLRTYKVYNEPLIDIIKNIKLINS